MFGIFGGSEEKEIHVWEKEDFTRVWNNRFGRWRKNKVEIKK